jgi:neutral ceramidase
VAISGIHTHAGPGGYLQYVVYIVTSLGFVRQSFDVIVNGIEQCIVEAHNNLHPGKIYVNKGIKLCLLSGTIRFSQTLPK